MGGYHALETDDSDRLTAIPPLSAATLCGAETKDSAVVATNPPARIGYDSAEVRSEKPTDSAAPCPKTA